MVDLIDRAPGPMTGASLHNEGKLHLGFVYAKDPFKATHKLMARGSLAFGRIIKDLTGCSPDALRPSQPFHYFVPVTSQLDMDVIHQHFCDVEGAIHEIVQTYGDVYLERQLNHYFELNSSDIHRSMFSPDSTLGSFRTEELSISPAAVANILCGAIRNQPNITFVANTEILAVHRLLSGDVEVEARRDEETLTYIYAAVANCLWDDKPRVDDTAGIRDQGPWILRYKAMIHVSATAVVHSRIPSATGILGRYGDIVNHDDGTYYISWYPLCKLAETIHGDGRNLQNLLHHGPIPRYIRKATYHYPSISKLIASTVHMQFIKDNFLEMAVHVPSITSLLNNSSHCELGGGVILAHGTTDIDDPESQLHQRSQIGPVAYDSYVTIDTGKYCTAPLFAIQAADMIANIL